MASSELLSIGSNRIRVGPWRLGGPFGYLVPLTSCDQLTDTAIDAALERLAGKGYTSVLTAALLPVEQERFLRRGFTVDQRLHLLHADLDALPPRRPSVPTRRARRTERPAILSLDHRAFDEFWRLDDLAFSEARRATPRARVRVAEAQGRLTGYAITGRAGPNGYLQRLAVDPDDQGRGVGTSLILDAMAWLRRRGASRLTVNTQEHNERALALYERTGFVRQPGGLAVLRLEL